jgi:nucleotide sugar dehydrogenase
LNLLDEPGKVAEAVRAGRVHVAVYGAGRVGVTIAAAWLRAGARVILADIDAKRVDTILEGRSVFADEPHIDESFRAGFANRRFLATTSPSQAASIADVNIVAVPVGLKSGRADLASVRSAFSSIAARMQKGSISILETSVPPGTCRETVLPILEGGKGLKVEADFALAYSPERIFEGRTLKDLEENYPKVVAGFGPRSARAASELYSVVAKKGVLLLSSLEAAEVEKLFEGVYRDVNIALANELGVICERLGVDYWEVQRAANSQPFSHLHRPGIGVGGACIPIYPTFVVEAAKKRKASTSITEEARTVNRSMPALVAKEALALLGKGRRDVAVLGLAFRGDVADDRLSPTYDLLTALKKARCKVRVHDPLVGKEEADGFPVSSDLGRTLDGCTLVIVATDHSAYRALGYEELKRLSKGEPVTFDGRGVLEGSRFPPGKLAVLGRGHTPS